MNNYGKLFIKSASYSDTNYKFVGNELKFEALKL
jgi:hypothetical protein